MYIALGLAAFPQAQVPVWVSTGGTTPAFPPAIHLVGYAVVEGNGALERARSQAAADLAKRVLLRVEQTTTDLAKESGGVAEESVVSMTRTTTNLALTGLRFETFEQAGKAHVIAVLERAQAAKSSKGERDKAVTTARTCLESARAKTGADSLTCARAQDGTCVGRRHGDVGARLGAEGAAGEATVATSSRSSCA